MAGDYIKPENFQYAEAAQRASRATSEALTGVKEMQVFALAQLRFGLNALTSQEMAPFSRMIRLVTASRRMKHLQAPAAVICGLNLVLPSST
jgi:hypothetical protein